MPHCGKQLARAERQRRHSSAPRSPAGTKHERDLLAGSAKSECAQGVEQRGAKPQAGPQRGELSRAARHGGRTHPRRPHRRPSKMHPRNGFPAGCRRQPLPWTMASRRHRENAFPRMTPWDLPRKAEARAPAFAYSPAISIEAPHAPQYLAARLDSTISGYRTPRSSSQLRSRSLEVTAASPIASACVRLQGS